MLILYEISIFSHELTTYFDKSQSQTQKLYLQWDCFNEKIVTNKTHFNKVVKENSDFEIRDGEFKWWHFQVGNCNLGNIKTNCCGQRNFSST